MSKIKLSDYVINELVAHGTKHVFGMSGGAAVHLFDSAQKNPDMEITFVAHEQSAAMAADGYSRVSGNVGTCIVTSGPGATNLLTGVCCSFYDSISTLMLTGQVATHRLRGDHPIRQRGFQETQTVDIFRSVTKSAEQVLDPENISDQLALALSSAQAGRCGPALIDIPDDFQRAFIADRKASLDPEAEALPDGLSDQIRDAIQHISTSERPVVVLGGGLDSPPIHRQARKFLEKLNIPSLQTWAGLDVIPYDWPLRVGTFGVYGPRLGNFTIQNADTILCLGSRLSQNLTGGVLDSFAPDAHIIMVDIDQGELDKFEGFGIDIDIASRINCSLKQFLSLATDHVSEFERPSISEWLQTIEGWREELPDDIPPPPPDDAGFVDAHFFVRELSQFLAEDELIFLDTGGNLTWCCNNLRVKDNQRVISAWNFTPMGYSLPASIGGAAAAKGRPVTCIIGDGGLQLCLGELSTIVRHNLPIRVILFNNHAHGIQRQTLETWLDGKYVGVDETSGLAFADFPQVATALGFTVYNVSRTSEMSSQLSDAYSEEGPTFINVEIDSAQKLYPVVKSGYPLEQQLPPISN